MLFSLVGVMPLAAACAALHAPPVTSRAPTAAPDAPAPRAEATRRLFIPPYGRHLVRENGRAFLYLADTCWELFHRTTREEADLYLRDRAHKGFTVVQATAVSEIDGLTTPNSDGALPFLDRDPAKPNEAYFKYVDDVLTRAEAAGLVIALAPMWGDRWNNPADRSQEIFTTPASAEAYGAWLGARLAKRDIIWVLGGGRNPETDQHLAIVRALAAGLKKGDGGAHLMTYHPRRGGNSASWFAEDDWISFHMFQSGHEAPNMPEATWVTENYERNPAKPTLDGEAAFEDHPYNWDPTKPRFNDYDVRKLAYWSLLSGAAGHAYGHDSVWQLWQPDRKPWSFARTPWKEALDSPGAVQMGHVRALFESRPFQLLVPDAGLVVHPSDEGHDLETAALSEDRRFAMIYAPLGRPLTIALGRLRAERVRAWWFDPRTGAARDVGEVDGGVPHQFVSPAEKPGHGNDWILVLDDAAAGFPAPGTGHADTRLPAPVPHQALLVDGVFHFKDDGFVGDIHPPNPLPSWTSPVNFREGTLHVRVEVMTKANATTPITLFLRLSTGSHKDRHQVIAFGRAKVVVEKPGVFYFEEKVSAAEPLLPPSTFQWDAPIKFLQVAAGDAEGHRVSNWEQDLGKFTGDKKDYFPLRVRYSAFLVPVGQTFVPPVFW